MRLQRVFIAERGVMAPYLISTYAAMGLETVVPFGSVSEHLPHIEQADFAVHLEEAGPPERLVDAANDAGCEAIHPGVGPLAEDARFAEQVGRANLLWIGSPHEQIQLLADRWGTRQAALGARVPVVPGGGMIYAAAQIPEAVATAVRLGMPVWLKDSEGVLAERVDSTDALARRLSERLAAGQRLWLEQHVREARHFAVTVVGDRAGSLVSLGVRERARRRGGQLEIDEFPASIPPDLSISLENAALSLAKARRFVGVGSVGFLTDPTGGAWSLGLRPRMQLGAVLNDAVLGLRLAEVQLRLAAGDNLGWTRQDLRANGVAIGLRVRATELGEIDEFRLPTGLTAYSVGTEGPCTDDLLAMLVVSAPTRQACVVRAVDALRKVVVRGLATNLGDLTETLTTAGFWTAAPQA